VSYGVDMSACCRQDLSFLDLVRLQGKKAHDASGYGLDLQVSLVQILVSGLEECFLLDVSPAQWASPSSYSTADLGPSPG
jgi:hypothetical protein